MSVVADGPVKKIACEDDIEPWTRSIAYWRITRHIAALAEAIAGHSLTEEVERDDVAQRLLGIFDVLDSWIEDIPLRKDPQRFGNLAFRDWGKRLQGQAAQLHNDIPSGDNSELLHHFTTSFGSFTRIDYGSGHELSFMAYLCILTQTGALTQRTLKAQVMVLFPRYLALCHRLHTTYRLEPAGSKGAWGLDDYHFLPYLFGASQFLNRDVSNLPPVSSIQRVTSLDDKLAIDNLFYRSLAHIHAIKKGPFHEHSPVLHNIAVSVPNWIKVYSGLNKMYAKEVLEKWPVVQHFYFGPYLSWHDRNTNTPLASSIKGTVTALDGPSSAGQNETEDDMAAVNAAWKTTMDTMNATAAPWSKQASRPAL